MELKPVEACHYPEIASIYLEGIATGHATFALRVPSWEEWDKAHLSDCRIGVFNNEDLLLGWTALSPVSNRCVYAGVAEVSIYIRASERGKGIGKMLLNHLIACSEETGLWTLQSGTFPENEASIRLHIQCGFRKVGYRERIGSINGIWRDTVLLERRSKTTGI